MYVHIMSDYMNDDGYTDKNNYISQQDLGRQLVGCIKSCSIFSALCRIHIVYRC